MRMRQLSALPDGKTSKVRSVELEPHVDALIYQHMEAFGFASLSAALRDLVDRGLGTTGALAGAGGDQRSRAYREAGKKVERELREVVSNALRHHLDAAGVAAPRVVAARGAGERRVERAKPRSR